MGAGERAGRYVLEARLGAGGMGEVWRATGPDGPAAVKVLRAGDAVGQVLAALGHPRILGILDRGTLGNGAPWIATELAQHTLVGLPTGGLGRAVAHVLEGLAHAHARGILHRDLKPENVLGFSRPTGEIDWRLADFGLARAWRSIRGRTARASGTPAFMAPEQVRRDAEAEGPGTDLYALGCVVWELTTGRPPFDHDDPAAVLRDHLTRDPPPWAPRGAVPAGLEDWLRSLLEKAPSDRPPSAAHARSAFLALGPIGAVPAPAPATTYASFSLDALTTDVPELPTAAGATRARCLPVPALPPEAAPPRSARSARSTALLGARALAFVGRRRERGVLWDALRAVAEGRGPRVVVVSAAPGFGVSRLLRWLRETVSELGAGVVVGASGRSGLVDDLVDAALRGPFAPPAGPRPSVRDLLAELGRRGPVILTCDELETDPAGVRTVLAALRGLPALAVFARPDPADAPECATTLDRVPGDHVALGPLEPADLAGLVRDVLALSPVSAGRIEEAAAGSPALAVELVGAALRGGSLRDGPDGFVLADGPLPAVGDADWAAPVAALGGPHLDTIRTAALLGDRVDSSLLRHLAADADEAVDELVLAGLVTASPEGLHFCHPAIRRALTRELPDLARRRAAIGAARAAAGQRASARAHDLLAAGDPRAAEVLLAAAHELHDSGALTRALAFADEARSVPAADSVRAGLATRRSDTLRILGRFDEAIAAADEALAAAPGPKERVEGHRQRGLALLRAGRSDEAHAALSAGVAHLPEGDLGRGRLLVALGTLSRRLGHVDRAADELEQGLAAARAVGSRREEADLRVALGIVALLREGPTAAEAWMRAAGEAYRTLGVTHGVASVENHLGILAVLEGDPARAEGHLASAEEMFRRAGAVDAVFPAAARVWAAFAAGRTSAAQEALSRLAEELATGSGRALLGPLWPLLVAVGAARRRDLVAADRALDEVLAGQFERDPSAHHLAGLLAADLADTRLAPRAALVCERTAPERTPG